MLLSVNAELLFNKIKYLFLIFKKNNLGMLRIGGYLLSLIKELTSYFIVSQQRHSL